MRTSVGQECPTYRSHIYIGRLGQLKERWIGLMRAIYRYSDGRTPVGGLVFAANWVLERIDEVFVRGVPYEIDETARCIDCFCFYDGRGLRAQAGRNHDHRRHIAASTGRGGIEGIGAAKCDLSL